MDFGEIDIQDIVGGVVVADLSACPVETFDFDGFVVADGAAEGDYNHVLQLFHSESLNVGFVEEEYHRGASGSNLF